MGTFMAFYSWIPGLLLIGLYLLLVRLDDTKKKLREHEVSIDTLKNSIEYLKKKLDK